MTRVRLVRHPQASYVPGVETLDVATIAGCLVVLAVSASVWAVAAFAAWKFAQIAAEFIRRSIGGY